MKITYFQLEPQLKKLARSYIVSGDELFLKQDAINLIRKAAKQAGFTERVRLGVEAGFNWDSLYTLLYSPSLMGEKRLIELDFRDHLPPKNASKILETYAAEEAVSDHILLVDVSKVDDKIARSGWYKSLEKISTVVAIWPIPRQQLPQWINQRAKKYKLTLTADAIQLLADYVEGNLIAAAQAIEKLYLLQPKTPVDCQLIETVLTDESSFTVFDLIEAMTGGDAARALHILNHLASEGTEPTLILWAITRELHVLAELAEQLKQGISQEKLFREQRIFARRQPSIRKFLARFSAADCWQNLVRAAEIDRIIKGAAPGNVWEQFELFCLRFAI